jgi:UDP-glucose 4-epimerase
VEAADVCRDDLVSVFRGADAVVHLAWRFHLTRHPRETWRDNVLGSERTLQAATEARVPVLVYASSVGAYSPGPHTTGQPDEPVDESWPTHALPTAAYGRQKSYVERLLDLFELRYDMRIVRLRSAFVFQRIAAPEQRRIFAGPFVPGRLLGKLPVLPVPRGLRIDPLITWHDAESAFEAWKTQLVGCCDPRRNTVGRMLRQQGYVRRPVILAPITRRRLNLSRRISVPITKQN